MKTKWIAAIWTAIAAALIALSLNGMSDTLGWGLSVKSPIGFDAKDRSTTAHATVYLVSWISIQAALLFVTFELLRRNARRMPWARLPFPSDAPPIAADTFGHRLRIAFIVFVALAPLYAGGHFLRKTLSADVYCGPVRLIESWHEHFTLSSGDRCWLDGPSRGVQYFPPWEAWVLTASVAAIALMWAIAVYRLARK